MVENYQKLQNFYVFSKIYLRFGEIITIHPSHRKPEIHRKYCFMQFSIEVFRRCKRPPQKLWVKLLSTSIFLAEFQNHKVTNNNISSRFQWGCYFLNSMLINKLCIFMSRYMDLGTYYVTLLYI